MSSIKGLSTEAHKRPFERCEIGFSLGLYRTHFFNLKALQDQSNAMNISKIAQQKTMKIHIQFILIFTIGMPSLAQEVGLIPNESIAYQSGFKESNKGIWDDGYGNLDENMMTKPIGIDQPGVGFVETPHRDLGEGEIPVTEPGYYGSPGTTYVLMNDISSPKSAIFLGNNVTLDLNGYEIRYADAAYEHIPNYSFEEGLVEWDFSNAPNAKIEGTKVQVFVGENVLRLSEGEEITSQYINLPVADRSYFAMCGVAKNTMRVSVYIEDENGEVVYSTNNYGNSQKQGSPVENKGTQLGGGFVYAHMVGQPAGQYRVRIKANTDAIIDHIDIRPALDVGIGIIEQTFTNAHTDHLYAGWYDPAFYDYTVNFPGGTPLEGIPVVEPGAKGTMTIKNGTVRSGTKGILSWGIQSTANRVDLNIDNVKIVSSGINTNAVEVRQAMITNCSFDINTPFIINRHNSGNYAVDILGTQASEVAYSEFYGGQGCLSFKGIASEIHHNFFFNRQTVTNHYSIGVGGDHSKIFNNVFKPELGSGIGMGNQHVEIYNNEIHIEAAPPTCEYGHEDYSVNGIRLADYNAPLGDPDGCFDNKVYNNKFFITGKDYPEYPDYIPVATAIFYSASGGDNYIYDNEVVVNALDPDSKARTNAFYVGGGTIGGVFENNTVTTNVPAFWLASPYGDATKTRIIDNTIIRSSDALENYMPIRLGYGSNLATEIDFISNDIVGGNEELEFGGTNRQHTFSTFWKFTLKVVDIEDNPVEGKEVKIIDNNENVSFEGTTPATGVIDTILMEYDFYGRLERPANPYRVVAGKQEVEVSIKEDTEITLKVSEITGTEPTMRGFAFGSNPVEDTLHLFFERPERRKIVILDINHKTRLEQTSNDKNIILDMSFLPSGVYVLEIMEEDKIRTEKIVKY